jgi:hypothetical protein
MSAAREANALSFIEGEEEIVSETGENADR